MWIAFSASAAASARCVARGWEGVKPNRATLSRARQGERFYFCFFPGKYKASRASQKVNRREGEKLKGREWKLEVAVEGEGV